MRLYTSAPSNLRQSQDSSLVGATATALSEERRFFEQYEQSQLQVQERIVKAKELLPSVTISDDFQLKISQICSELEIEGLRGDIVVNRAAKAYAAYDGRTSVTVNDIEKIIVLCLRHRLRKDPLESIDSGDKVKKIFNEIFEVED